MGIPDEVDPATQALDWVFTYYASRPTWDRQMLSTPVAPGPAVLATMDGPPEVKDADDLRAANAWLQREWERLRQYTQLQLGRIQKESQELVNQNHLNEQAMIQACQELSRKEELLTRQSRALQQQAAALSGREAALVEQLGAWSQAQAEFPVLREQHQRTEQEAAQAQALLESLRGELQGVQQARQATQAELETLAQAAEEQRAAREKEQALTRALQAEMEQRRRALERAEQAAQRREAELDELEARLRAEFEEQDRQLSERRREVNALYARLRQEGPRATKPAGGPPP